MGRRYSPLQLRQAFDRMGYRWQTGRMNLAGVRSQTNVPNRFDDLFCVVRPDGVTYHEFRCTTDPGTHWLLNPMRVAGTAILPPGQYLDTWQLGLHQNSYKALVQRKPVTVIRDGNKNNTLDFNAAARETGLFGINIHRANSQRESVQVDRWSAGCQVLANPQSFAQLIAWAEDEARRGHQWFTYTLLEEKDFS